MIRLMKRSTYINLLWVTILALDIASGMANANSDQSYLKGIKLFKGGQYEAAEKQLKASDLPDAKALLAIIILDYKESTQAEKSYAQRFMQEASEHGNSQALFQLAIQAYSQRDFETFEKNVRKAAENHKIAAVAYALYLGTLKNPARVSEAIFWAEKAITLGSDRGSIVKANYDGVFRENYYLYKRKIEDIVRTGFSEAYLLKFFFEKRINNKEDIMWLYLASDFEDSKLKNYSNEQKDLARKRALEWLLNESKDKEGNIGQSAKWCQNKKNELFNKCTIYAVTDDFNCRSIQIKDLDTTIPAYRQTLSYQMCRTNMFLDHLGGKNG